MLRYDNIPQLTSTGSYAVDVPLDGIENTLARWKPDLCPDFQREYVWTEQQQIRYVEYLLSGGHSGKDIYFNHPNWMTTYVGEMVVVDGKQRLNAVISFLLSQLKVYKHFYNQYTDDIPSSVALRFHVNNLKKRTEVLRWYIEMNSGGTVHTEAELNYVKQLLEKERK